MKKIFTIITLMIITVAAFATPRLEGNKIYLNEAAPSKNAVKKFIANNGGEEALDIPDEVGHTKRMQLELFINPNKVIEFENTADAKRYYNAIFSFNGGKPHYYPDTSHYENNEFILFIELSDWCTIPDSTPTYCYVSSFY